jgi:hypothetical protein
MIKSEVVLSVFIATALVGCGSSGKVAPVSGVITLDGKPLANGHIAFQPESQSGTKAVGSFAFTDANGAYKLRTADTEQPGAVIGKHRVEINLVAPSDDRPPASRPPAKTLPSKYNRDTELQFEVTSSGTDAANFDLKSR